MQTKQSARAAGPGPTITDHQLAGGKRFSASPILEDRPDIRVATLRALLNKIDVFEAMRRCAVRDAITDALAETWDRRARSYEWARPKPSDYPGLATTAELAARDRRCADIAAACRTHSDLIRSGFFDD